VRGASRIKHNSHLFRQILKKSLVHSSISIFFEVQYRTNLKMSELTETQSQQQDTSTSSKSTQPKQQAERIPGHTILPIARIKRVIKEDKEISLINGEATFCVAAATVSCEDHHPHLISSIDSDCNCFTIGTIYGISCE
jgi:hypothetical protein